MRRKAHKEAHNEGIEMYEIISNYKVFFTGYAVGCLTTVLINIVYHKIAFNKERSKRESSNQIVQTLDKDLIEPITIKAEQDLVEEQKSSVSPVVKTLIYKIRGGTKPNNEFWKSEFESSSPGIENISADRPKRHSVFLMQKGASLKIVSAVIFSICLFYALFIIFSKTFPANYHDRFKMQQLQSTVTNQDENRNITQIQSSSKNSTNQESKFYDDKALIHKNEVYQNKSGNEEKQFRLDSINENYIRHGKFEREELSGKNNKNGEYWYIIELQDGENIITQNAIENDGIITVWRPDGSERKFRRNEVKSVKKTKL
jgi:hypothetical protein